MSLIYGEDERCLEWAAEVIGMEFRPDAVAIGRARRGELVAVCAYDGFSDCDVNIHIASDGSRWWLTRHFLVSIFAYPFIQCGLRRVTGLVPGKNTQALRFNRKLGFQIEGRCRNALPDDDVVILGLLRSECRFIPPEHRND